MFSVLEAVFYPEESTLIPQAIYNNLSQEPNSALYQKVLVTSF